MARPEKDGVVINCLSNPNLAPAMARNMSDVLNSDENIVNIALIAFCLLAVTELAHWPMSSLLSCGVGLCPIVCYSCHFF